MIRKNNFLENPGRFLIAIDTNFSFFHISKTSLVQPFLAYLVGLLGLVHVSTILSAHISQSTIAKSSTVTMASNLGKKMFISSCRLVISSCQTLISSCCYIIASCCVPISSCRRVISSCRRVISSSRVFLSLSSCPSAQLRLHS